MVLQVRLPKLEHFSVETNCMGSVRHVAVDGLPCILSQRCAPALKSLALKGLSQEPFSMARPSQRRRYCSITIRRGTVFCTDSLVPTM